MKKSSILPEWATEISKGRIEVDPDLFHPAFLKELGVEKDKIDQYWLEVSQQCMKLDLQRIVTGTELAPKPGGALIILIKNRPDWALKNHPKGKGPDAATQGKEARQHYRRIRGGLF